jgi:hypothetical protein
VVQRSEHAHRALELARAEAEGFGHRYLGPEHLVLRVQRHGDNGASELAGGTGDGHPGPLLFDRDASWTQRPPRPVSSGATVIRDGDRLAGGVASLLR